MAFKDDGYENKKLKVAANFITQGLTTLLNNSDNIINVDNV